MALNDAASGAHLRVRRLGHARREVAARDALERSDQLRGAAASSARRGRGPAASAPITTRQHDRHDQQRARIAAATSTSTPTRPYSSRAWPISSTRAKKSGVRRMPVTIASPPGARATPASTPRRERSSRSPRQRRRELRTEVERVDREHARGHDLVHEPPACRARGGRPARSRAPRGAGRRAAPPGAERPAEARCPRPTRRRDRAPWPRRASASCGHLERRPRAHGPPRARYQRVRTRARAAVACTA